MRKELRGTAVADSTGARILGERLFDGYYVQDVMIIPAAAAVLTPKVAQPKYLTSGEFTRLPITLRLLVRRMTSRIRGGAKRPLITADQNSIFTALKPTKFSTKPNAIATAITR